MSDTQDALSPTTLVINYLRGKGLQPNAQNIRAALTENARDPSLIPGLRNSAPGNDNGPSVGQSGSAAKAIEGTGSASKSMPVPPIPPTATDATKATSAPPQADNGSGLDWESILGLGGAGIGAGALGASLLGRTGNSGVDPNAAEFVGNAGPPAFAPAAGPDAIPAPTEQPVIAGDPMQAALAKATAEPQVPQIGVGAPNNAVVPSNTIPMPDQTSGPTITPPNEASGPTIIPPRTEPPRSAPFETPGLEGDFMRFIRGMGRAR